MIRGMSELKGKFDIAPAKVSVTVCKSLVEVERDSFNRAMLDFTSCCPVGAFSTSRHMPYGNYRLH
ncbi:hypothetical protein HDF09_002637 [Edaphobacter lichenicola]|uniref:Uncharacterized protein n=1 Tax=Tunturiibacter empetritectus TaxID=3069691 RepID=A0A7W8MRL0_9BACT|nr:hypothetical protein [Edaphobacter lichenicola]